MTDKLLAITEDCFARAMDLPYDMDRETLEATLKAVMLAKGGDMSKDQSRHRLYTAYASYLSGLLDDWHDYPESIPTEAHSAASNW